MGFFSDPYGQEQLRDNPTISATAQHFLAQFAQAGYTGDLPMPGATYRMVNGDVVAVQNGGGWKKFAITAAALVGGGIVAGGGLASPAATSGATTATETAANQIPDAQPPMDGNLPSRPTVPPTGTLPTVGTGLPKPGGTVLDSLKKWGPLAGDIGKVASTAAQAQANARREDAGATARAIAENNQAKVQAANYNLKLPEVRTNQAARGEVLNTMQDAPLTGDPRIDKFSGGGLRPSAFGPQSRAAGAELSRTALSSLMNPAADRLTPQEIPGTHANTPENIAAGIGIGGDIFSLLAKYGGQSGTR